MENQTLAPYATTLLVQQKKSPEEVIEALTQNGMEAGEADALVTNLQQQIKDAVNAKAKKDMMVGGLFCGIGTVLTIADIGFIFWGAIIFGGIQLFKGMSNYSK